MILEGRGISAGKVQGEAVKVDERVSFLGDVDPETGKVFKEKDISDSIFVFPGGKGSTVGSYVIYQLKKNDTAPKAIINESCETIVASGAIISEIPLVDKIDIDLIEEGDLIDLDGEVGKLDLKEVDKQPVVTAFLKKNQQVLILRRSERVGSYQGMWSAVSGYLESSDPFEQALIEIEEETGLKAELVSKGKPVRVRYRGEKMIWEINPYIFKTDGEPELNWENKDYRWVKPEEMKEMNTVPKLWDAYLSARCEDES